MKNYYIANPNQERWYTPTTNTIDIPFRCIQNHYLQPSTYINFKTESTKLEFLFSLQLNKYHEHGCKKWYATANWLQQNGFVRCRYQYHYHRFIY